MAAGFLGRVFRLGRALVSYGLGGGSSVTTVDLPIITVAMDADVTITSALS